MRQSKFALLAAQDLEHALQVVDMDRIWYCVQGLLVAAGNISKLLWPGTTKFSAEAAALRKQLSVSDNSVLAPRKFRNHFEHFDERLADWASNGRGAFVDSNVGPTGFIGGFAAGDCLRNFDTTTHAITFRGETYELRPVLQAVRDIHSKVSVTLGLVD